MSKKIQKNNDKFEWSALDCYNYYSFKKPWSMSRLERIVFKALCIAKIPFETEKTFDWLLNENGSKMRCDFFLPTYGIIIECHGAQHFHQVYSNRNLNEQLKTDELKRYLCEDEHGLKLIYFTECEFKTILDEDLSVILFRNIEKLINYIILNGKTKNTYLDHECKQ